MEGLCFKHERLQRDHEATCWNSCREHVSCETRFTDLTVNTGGFHHSFVQLIWPVSPQFRRISVLWWEIWKVKVCTSVLLCSSQNQENWRFRMKHDCQIQSNGAYFFTVDVFTSFPPSIVHLGLHARLHCCISGWVDHYVVEAGEKVWSAAGREQKIAQYIINPIIRLTH